MLCPCPLKLPLVILTAFLASLASLPAQTPSVTSGEATGAPAGAVTIPTPAPEAKPLPPELVKLRETIASLKFQKGGTIILHNGLAKITLPDDFAFLNPDDAEKMLTQVWGNPPGPSPLGMIVPADFNPFSPNAWAVVISFNEDGYVKDDDASSIDYDKLLAGMKEGVAVESKKRVDAGYTGMELIGWAEAPHYDSSSHKLYWARELKFSDAPNDHTLNYNIRMLGRRGVLVLNAVSDMRQLDNIKAATPKILAMVDFQEGHRYTDYNSSTDTVAAYGIAALVAGGLAAKAGLFKGLLVALLALKKFIIVIFAALAAFIRKFWRKISGKNQPPP